MEKEQPHEADIRALFLKRKVKNIIFEPSIFNVCGDADVSQLAESLRLKKKRMLDSGNTADPQSFGMTYLEMKVDDKTKQAYPYFGPKYSIPIKIEEYQEIIPRKFSLILANYNDIPFIFFNLETPQNLGNENTHVRLALVGLDGVIGNPDGEENVLRTTHNKFPYYVDSKFLIQRLSKTNDSAQVYEVRNPLDKNKPLELIVNTGDFTHIAEQLKSISCPFYFLGILEK